MTTEERTCLEVAFKHAIERWQGKAARAKGPANENYAEGGVRALEELQEQMDRLGL